MPNTGWFSHFFYHYSSNYWISFCKDIYTTTHYLYHYYTKQNHYIESFNKNAALEILFIQSPVNAIFMMEEMESRTAGTSM